MATASGKKFTIITLLASKFMICVKIKSVQISNELEIYRSEDKMD